MRESVRSVPGSETGGEEEEGLDQVVCSLLRHRGRKRRTRVGSERVV